LSRERSLSILGIPYCTREGRVEANVQDALQVIRQEAGREPVDLVVLPELFTCGYCAPRLASWAEPLDGPTMQSFRTCAEELDTLIGFGFAEVTGQERTYNSWALFEPDGQVHVYRKTHLHPAPPGSPVNEREMLLPGPELQPFHTRLGTIGVMICYDGCFVEVPRTLALQGADVILWPSRSGAYLASLDLARVRAYDNVIPVVQVEGAQDGPYMPLKGWSIAARETGEVVVNQRQDATPFRVAFDLEAAARLRHSTEAGSHTKYANRRPELYRAITDAQAGCSPADAR
jgi:predicted amidohydrolase